MHNGDPEQVYPEPWGPHKRIGASFILPTHYAVSSILPLRLAWEGHKGSDVLMVISPGLMPEFRILELLLSVVGDPQASVLAEKGEVDNACVLKSRLYGHQDAAGPEPLQEPGRRCFITMMPPWLVPISSFEKVVVFITDPRYTILREIACWGIQRRRHGIEGMEGLEPEDFLKTYIQKDSAHLAGEELHRMSSWAYEEAKEPDRVKLVFSSDFVANANAATRDLGHFLGMKQPEVAHQKLLAAGMDKGFFSRCTNKPETAFFRSLISKFEDNFPVLSLDGKAMWEHNVSLWTQSPNRRMATLGLTLQKHEHELVVSPGRLFVSAHEAGVCKPCYFVFKKNVTCQRGEDCEFCHDPMHSQPLRKRASKKERDRLKRQAERLQKVYRTASRTPSPSGLSS
eukprot:TRINITY_DN12525_c0_g2_i1.p1 TRINITY_DN12525_c0_g2~~TRINITY_DN12525_c0_g2_i1.p1  ORF type:complete len:399 (+),score=43.67 TRINITY_DN12525_c0_g2_i1:117-1313(+)